MGNGREAGDVLLEVIQKVSFHCPLLLTAPASALSLILPQKTCLLETCDLALERDFDWNLLWATEETTYGCLHSYSYLPRFQKASWIADRSEYPLEGGKSAFLLSERALERGLAVGQT